MPPFHAHHTMSGNAAFTACTAIYQTKYQSSRPSAPHASLSRPAAACPAISAAYLSVPVYAGLYRSIPVYTSL